VTKGTSIRYSEEELAYIKQNCSMPRKEAHRNFCEEFKRTDVSPDNFKALCKRKGWKTGRTGKFQKGNVPANTGKKMLFNANSARTQFKKGHTPHNTNYSGHERLTKKDGYIEISIDEVNPHTGFERRYVFKHRYLWEKQHGKLPDGMCLKCLDGNRQNTDPANWEAIPRGALPFLNGHRGYNYDDMPPELRPSVLALAKVKYAKSKAGVTS
jgi:hypothetical protein